MTRLLRARLARAALAAVKAQFAADIDEIGHAPVLYEPGFHARGWTIAWNGGPEEWTLRAFQGYFDSAAYRKHRDDGADPTTACDLATTNNHPAPTGVWAEPVNSWCLAIYPTDTD